MNPAVLIPRASRPRPEKQPMGTIEIGGRNAETPLSSAASLLKNEFSQSFDDIAKIQRQEVNAIKGMNTGSQGPSPSVVNMPGQTSPDAQLVSVPGSTPTMVSTPEVSAVPIQQQPQQQPQQPAFVPVSPQQTMASFAAAPQSLSTAGQPLPAQFAPQAPMEIAPGFARGKPEPAINDQVVQAPEPAMQATEPAMQAPEPAMQVVEPQISKKSPFTEVQVPPGFQPPFPISGVPFPFFQPAELPPQVALPAPAEVPQGYPFSHPFLNPIPQPESDDSDRPSVNIQVQTSKSKIPKLKNKQKDTKDNKKKTH